MTLLLETHSNGYVVLGSRNDEYIVQRGQHSWSCSCPSSLFRSASRCKHVQFLEQVEETDPDSDHCCLCYESLNPDKAAFRCLECQSNCHLPCFQRYCEARTECCPSCEAKPV